MTANNKKTQTMANLWHNNSIWRGRLNKIILNFDTISDEVARFHPVLFIFVV